MEVASCDLKVNNKEKVLEEMADAVERALEGIGAHIEGEAKEELSNAPKRIDTGLLRNSITYALGGEMPHTRTYHAQFANERTKNGNRIRATSKSAKSVNIGSYQGSAPADGEGERSVYIGSNVEYAA